MKLSRFEDLDCWKEARQLTRQIYEAIGRNQTWQKDLRLCGQMQGAAVSVMANIAEGLHLTQFMHKQGKPAESFPVSSSILEERPDRPNRRDRRN